MNVLKKFSILFLLFGLAGCLLCFAWSIKGSKNNTPSLNQNTKINTSPSLTDKDANDAGLYKATVMLIKKSEGLYLFPYRCPAGVLTIGWGHTYETDKHGNLTSKGKAELASHRYGITVQIANQLFLQEFNQTMQTVQQKLHPKERKHLLAFTSLLYNSGERGLMSKGTAVGVSYLNNESEQQIADRIKNRFVKGTSYEKGIRKRRKNESLLFSSSTNKVLELSQIWEADVKQHMAECLNAYGVTSTQRMNQKPQKRRSKIELSDYQIQQLLR